MEKPKRFRFGHVKKGKGLLGFSYLFTIPNTISENHWGFLMHLLLHLLCIYCASTVHLLCIYCTSVGFLAMRNCEAKTEHNAAQHDGITRTPCAVSKDHGTQLGKTC